MYEKELISAVEAAIFETERELPREEVDHDALSAVTKWNELDQELKRIKERELELRKALVAHFFDNKEEGSASVDLPEGWSLKANIKLTRSVDESTLEATLAELPANYSDELVKYKPSLVTKAYKALADEERAIFDETLVTKPATPTLKLVPPKE